MILLTESERIGLFSPSQRVLFGSPGGMAMCENCDDTAPFGFMCGFCAAKRARPSLGARFVNLSRRRTKVNDNE